jgi:hypothetical protein
MAGFVLCVAAGLIFLRYNERRVLRELEQHEAAS